MYNDITYSNRLDTRKINEFIILSVRRYNVDFFCLNPLWDFFVKKKDLLSKERETLTDSLIITRILKIGLGSGWVVFIKHV